MKITINGHPGSGKSTVAKVIAEKLGLKRYYMGGILRKLAKEKGMTLNELLKKGETEDWVDKHVDDILVNIGKKEDNFVVEGRTAYHFIPESVKIFLACDIMEGARRIHKDQHEKGKLEERNESVSESVEEKAENLKERIASDSLRYNRLYGLNIFEQEQYDLWIDTTNLAPEQVVQKILDFLKEK